MDNTKYLVKIPFKNEGEINMLLDEMKLREVIASRPALKESLREGFQARRIPEVTWIIRNEGRATAEM